MTGRFATDCCGMVLGALLSLSPLAARAAEPCTHETETIVCRNETRTIRVIADSTSPSARYAIGWIVPSAVAAKEFERNPEDGSLALPGGEPENVIVRLRDGAVISTMQSKHFGDHARYNHREIITIWSTDERLLLVWSNDKWETLASEALRLDGRGELTGRDDVLALVRRIGKERLSRRTGTDDADLHEPLILKERLHGTSRIDVVTALITPGSENGFTFTITLKPSDERRSRPLRAVHVGTLRK
ncbi:MAG: hypothetical protein BGN91_06685 [Nitrobacter sp. 62-13]|mgnify:CR=1 FL=1|jgi:hypothetical protein|uniref:hypothetical protein n=1 Tax=Nitrobacter sp. 62-13 TaxID=1895797 RepID=UPI00095D129F|nr:hypothetical protein [Nitrobacter sp. 62-13]OJU30244.1 MAG: hypothetical protein BGN91_06685 [Nitrobacter sp. 62-13]